VWVKKSWSIEHEEVSLEETKKAILNLKVQVVEMGSKEDLCQEEFCRSEALEGSRDHVAFYKGKSLPMNPLVFRHIKKNSLLLWDVPGLFVTLRRVWGI
jgi:hypothetical protein